MIYLTVEQEVALKNLIGKNSDKEGAIDTCIGKIQTGKQFLSSELLPLNEIGASVVLKAIVMGYELLPEPKTIQIDRVKLDRLLNYYKNIKTMAQSGNTSAQEKCYTFISIMNIMGLEKEATMITEKYEHYEKNKEFASALSFK